MHVNDTDLMYNVIDGLLTGEVDGKHINARANSGGRAGSKTAGVQNYFLANNPFATSVKFEKGKAGSVGGTLPLGIYTLRLHESRNAWIRLIPDASNNMRGRSGFAIHGRGKRGSDGCIVPSDFHVVLSLYALVKARKQKALPEITLGVVATGSDVDQKLRQWSTTA
jgi:hypothetical protein